MTIQEALSKGIEILKSSHMEAPAVEAGVILCFVINKDKAYLYAHGDRILSQSESDAYFRLIGQRAQGMPVQYITGTQEFMSLPFTVNRHVLIPRQDTEILVETVIDYVKSLPEGKLTVLDIGTGSGCIAVSLAYYLKEIRVTAVDISEGALDTARGNAGKFNVQDRITWVQSDVFSELNALKHRFDIIVSNPPYIPAWEVKTLQVEVKDFEPMAALDGGADGLDFYKSIIQGSADFLKPEGLLAFEVGHDQSREVSALMQKDYDNIRTVKDLAQIERVVTGQLRRNIGSGL